MSINKSTLGKLKYIKNTSWLFGEKLVSMFVSFPVGIAVVRYLGPEKFGILSYASTFVGIFSILLNLCANEILARELVKRPSNEYQLLGTGLLLKIVGATIAWCMILLGTILSNNNNETNMILIILAIGTLFQSLRVTDSYLIANVKQKYSAIIRSSSLLISSVVKIILIYFNATIYWFAAILLVESILVASGWVISYYLIGRNIFKWTIEAKIIKSLFKNSWPLILASIAIQIYMNIDKIMLKELLTVDMVGQYAAAVRISVLWYFIPIVITSSLFPAIVNSKKLHKEIYHQRLQEIHDILTTLAFIIIIPLFFASDWIINLLYGDAYSVAGDVLQIHSLSLLAVFWGTMRGKWIITENLQLKANYYHLLGMGLNVILNLLLIPNYGVIGAAWATVVSYWGTGYVISYIIKDFRLSLSMFNKSIINTITFKGVILILNTVRIRK